MTITRRITAQIDDVIRQIKAVSDEFSAENACLEKKKAEVTATSLKLKQQIRQHADAQIADCQQSLQSAIMTLATSRQEIVDFEQQLSVIVPRSQVCMSPVQGEFNRNDAQVLMSHICDNTFWAQVKKILCIGDYASDASMAAEIYGRIDNSYRAFEEKRTREQKRYEKNIRVIERNASEQANAVDAQCVQDLQNIARAHASKMDALIQRGRRIANDPRYQSVQQLLSKAAHTLGIAKAGWENYNPAKSMAPDLLIGVILYPCIIQTLSPELVGLLRLFKCYNERVNGFAIPLTVPMNQALLIYVESNDDSTGEVAGIFQSIVARRIRFMPPKSFRSYFFDPVNRGFSLGQLIHLSGEGSSQLCVYQLSPQEISMRLEKLTNHVDKVCRQLTSAGCVDVNAYNSVPGVKRIPYLTVVIHDFPAGLDSTALGYLQVLINKAKQCGISVLISHKQGDKIEHRAHEILELIQHSFWMLNISSLGKGTIAGEGLNCAFKPSPVKLSQAYLNQVNKYFTYKPSIDNNFTSLMAGMSVDSQDTKNGLSIPFAIDAQGKIVNLKIGYDLSAYGFISGGVGSGKTTLLHTIITSAVMRYHPADLELWLIDYKEAEFAFYMRNCPPHVKYVVADNSNEITYSILNEIEAEVRHRNAAFIAAGVKDFVEYRESQQCKRSPIPRLLVIIDEFHRMAQAAQEENEYKILLENIFSEGRSAGIVLLLCDQQISNGLSGLSQKSRDLISVRIALRNKADEIRETLAAESSQITDSVKKMILDTSAGVKGSAIYKYEIESKDDDFANTVIFKACRAIYGTPEDRVSVISRIVDKYEGFKRNKVFFGGAARRPMDISQINEFEKQYPQIQEEGERFYIGTPLGIQPCFFFNLRHGDSGENVLVVGNNYEKRLAIIKATILCAKRYKYNVQVLVARTSQLYRQNSDFFAGLSNAQVVTAFPEICKYVGENANRIKELYSENDVENGVSCGKRKEFAIFVGLDEIYAQMDSSTLTQKEAWSEKEQLHADAVGSNTEDSLNFSNAHRFSVNIDKDCGNANAEDDVTTEKLTSSLENIDELLARLEQEGSADVSGETAIPEKFAGVEGTTIKGYNAINDLSLLFSEGWKIGINTMVVVDRGTVFGKMRKIQLDGNFNHRIALVMSSDEAQCFMTKSRIMKNLIDSGDTISAVYEHMGNREQCFRPYCFQ